MSVSVSLLWYGQISSCPCLWIFLFLLNLVLFPWNNEYVQFLSIPVAELITVTPAVVLWVSVSQWFVRQLLDLSACIYSCNCLMISYTILKLLSVSVSLSLYQSASIIYLSASVSYSLCQSVCLFIHHLSVYLVIYSSISIQLIIGITLQ